MCGFWKKFEKCRFGYSQWMNEMERQQTNNNKNTLFVLMAFCFESNFCKENDKKNLFALNDTNLNKIN